MIENIQIYISDSFDPYLNLATEKYLLDTVPQNACTLYLWQNENTVVIGRNQNPWAECNCSLLEKEGGKLARRLSGGGAVFHDLGNLNFTFLCNEDSYDLTRQLQVIREACLFAGIETTLSGRNDILADNRKFSGNAFFNSKGKSYHHGTLMVCADTEKMQRYLTPSKAKLEAKGVKSVRSRVVNLSEFSPSLTTEKMKEYMISAFEKVYNQKASFLRITDNLRIDALAKSYQSNDYIYGGSAPFSFSCDKSFSWGQLQLQLEVKDGIVEGVKVYTDSMDFTLAERLQSALLSVRFNIADMGKALFSSLPTPIAEDIAELLKEQGI